MAINSAFIKHAARRLKRVGRQFPLRSARGLSTKDSYPPSSRQGAVYFDLTLKAQRPTSNLPLISPFEPVVFVFLVWALFIYQRLVLSPSKAKKVDESCRQF